jgi:DNA-binding MarR family transcriptional regulator
MDRDAVSRQIVEAVTELFFSAENQAKFHGAADELGLQPPVLKALLELEPGRGVPMRQLAESWGCDASFVTIVADELESAGLAERKVASYDRRIKTVELTPAGVEARDWAVGEVYGPRAGFDALTQREQATLARLLTKLAAAQAVHDATLLDQPDVRSTARRFAAQRTRQHREGRGGGWREHLDAHREELLVLKQELARMRDEFKAQARGPYEDLKADVKAEARRPVDEAKAEAKAAKAAAKDAVKAEVRAMRDELVDKLKAERRPR